MVEEVCSGECSIGMLVWEGLLGFIYPTKEVSRIINVAISVAVLVLMLFELVIVQQRNILSSQG